MKQNRLLITLIALAVLGIDIGVAWATPPALRVPEPGTLTLVASGAAALGGLGLLRRRKKK
jgi:predicted transporter